MSIFSKLFFNKRAQKEPDYVKKYQESRKKFNTYCQDGVFETNYNMVSGNYCVTGKCTNQFNPETISFITVHGNQS